MKTKYIIFDKDGTLLDFEKFWLQILIAATDKILNHYGADMELAEKIHSILGVENGIVNISGAYCQGESGATAQAFYDVLCKNGYKVSKEELFKTTGEMFISSYTAGELVPNCKDLRGFLLNLKRRGIGIAIATADTAESTKITLGQLGVSDCFDELFVADGIHPGKPDPYFINALCTEKGLIPDEIIMVGDTVKDMEFAKNGGVKAIAVAKNDTNRRILTPYAIATIEDLEEILKYIE